jgi:single-stranded DNA-binding protein
MAQIASDPELRLTQDNLEISSMVVEFDGLRSEDPPGRIKVIGWGNLAKEIKNNYTQGDRIIVEGRLSMNLIDMPEGYREKRAELIASHIYRFDSGNGYTQSTISSADTSNNSPVTSSPMTLETEPIKVKTDSYSYTPETTSTPENHPATSTSSNNDWDDIPF